MSMDQPPLRLLLRRQHTMIVGVAAAKLVKSPPLARASLRLAATTPAVPKQEHPMSMEQLSLRWQRTRIVGAAAAKRVTNLPLVRPSL